MPVQTDYNNPYVSAAARGGPGAYSKTSSDSPDKTEETEETPEGGTIIDAVYGDANDKLVSMEDFLTLMVAQLKNQDFMNPMDDTQYVTQLAQISSMQQMEEMAYNAKSTYATSLVGKTVQAAKFTVAGELKTTEGVVNKVSLLDGKFVIYVNGEPYGMDELMEIKTAAETSGDGDKNDGGNTDGDGNENGGGNVNGDGNVGGDGNVNSGGNAGGGNVNGGGNTNGGGNANGGGSQGPGGGSST